MGTLTIPLVSLPAGQRGFGPTHPADTDTDLALTLDRTVAGGLNSLTADSVIEFAVRCSVDAGATWQDLGAFTAAGGVYLLHDRFGNPAGQINVSSGDWPLPPGTSRQLQATLTVSGPSPIAVAGSIATQ